MFLEFNKSPLPSPHRSGTGRQGVFSRYAASGMKQRREPRYAAALEGA